MYNKESQEYISNGYYRIDGVDFMSIWTFKRKNNIEPNHDGVNGPDGIELFESGVMSYESKPDFGNYNIVLIYPVSDLHNFYNN